MVSFHSLTSVQSTTSTTDLASSSMEISTNAKTKSGEIYLSMGFLTLSDLLTIRVYSSTSSSDSVDSFESSSSFLSSNCIVSGLFSVWKKSLGSDLPPTYLKTTSQLYIVLLDAGSHSLYPFIASLYPMKILHTFDFVLVHIAPLFLGNMHKCII
jgi:hypothetical protein